MIPERSHALFPVAHYEFVWAQQLWNLAAEVEPYFQHYLETYVLPDGNFTYNTQDQVEAPLNAGVFLANSARAYDYARDLDALERRLPVLRRMITYVLDRYEYGLRTYPTSDPRHGLIWGSPEADLGDPKTDTPDAHPFLLPERGVDLARAARARACARARGERRRRHPPRRAGRQAPPRRRACRTDGGGDARPHRAVAPHHARCAQPGHGAGRDHAVRPDGHDARPEDARELRESPLHDGLVDRRLGRRRPRRRTLPAQRRSRASSSSG